MLLQLVFQCYSSCYLYVLLLETSLQLPVLLLEPTTAKMSYYGRNFKLRWGDDTVFSLKEDNVTVVYDLTVPNRQEDGHYVTATNYTYGFTFPFEEEFEVKDYTGWMKVSKQIFR